MSSADALTALGSDLTFSVSFTIAAELRLSAVDAGFSEHELIGIVLVLSIVLSALPLSLRRGARIVADAWVRVVRPRVHRAVPSFAVLVDWFLVAPANPKEAHSPSIMQFFELLLGIARRISMSLLVQLVAATAVSKQTLRLSRILSLLSVAIFFLFLQSGASTVTAAMASGVPTHRHA
jgi:hypothetical protein